MTIPKYLQEDAPSTFVKGKIPGYEKCKLMFAKDSLLRSTGSRVAPQGRSALVYIERWII